MGPNLAILRPDGVHPTQYVILGKISLLYEDLLLLPRPFPCEAESIGSCLTLSRVHRYVGSGTAKVKDKGHTKGELWHRILQYLMAKFYEKGLRQFEWAHGRWLQDSSRDLEIRLLALLPNAEEQKPYAILLEGLFIQGPLDLRGIHGLFQKISVKGTWSAPTRQQSRAKPSLGAQGRVSYENPASERPHHLHLMPGGRV